MALVSYCHHGVCTWWLWPRLMLICVREFGCWDEWIVGSVGDWMSGTLLLLGLGLSLVIFFESGF